MFFKWFIPSKTLEIETPLERRDNDTFKNKEKERKGCYKSLFKEFF